MKQYLTPAAAAELRGVTKGAIIAAINRGDLRVDVEIVDLDGKCRAQGIARETAEAWSATSHFAGKPRLKDRAKKSRKSL